MRSRIAIIVLFGFACLGTAAVATAQIEQKGNLRVTFDSSFAPRSLPRDRPAPITVRVSGSIATTDGSHPPALRRLEIELNRHGRISSEGLPTCEAPRLQSTTVAEALRRCKPASVGSGSFHAQLASDGGQIPVTGTIHAFNGVSAGRPSLLLHFNVTFPVSATLVLPFVISHKSGGQFGTVLAANIPVLAGGVGSITDLKLKVGRKYRYRGERRSFISAACAAPVGFPGAPFPFARGKFSFQDGRRIDSTLMRNCDVR